jgi:hypothetical protein
VIQQDQRVTSRLSTYLNRRIWAVPENVTVSVDELRTIDRTNWPKSKNEADGRQSSPGPDRRTNTRKILGASYYIHYPDPGFKRGKLEDEGTVELRSGTRVHWFLWSGERPAVQSYAAISGYIAALYENELFDITAHSSNYRGFGVSDSEVRRRLWLVLEPPRLDQDGQFGVYPRTDRNSLLLRGGAAAGEPLPIADWAAEFADKMPAPIVSAIRAARVDAGGTITDPHWRDRLAERFGALWRLVRLRAKPTGALSVTIVQASWETHQGDDARPKVVRSRAGAGRGRTDETNLGSRSGPTPAVKSTPAGGIPVYIPVRAEDIGEQGMLAAWQPHHPEHPEGAVLLNIEHPVLEAEIHRWQSMYPDHLSEAIGKEVIDVYGEIIVAKVAHSEHLKVSCLHSGLSKSFAILRL